MVDIDNTKQADKKEKTEMDRRANHNKASKPKYREVKRALCSVYIQIKLLSNSATEVEDIQFRFIEHSQEICRQVMKIKLIVVTGR